MAKKKKAAEPVIAKFFCGCSHVYEDGEADLTCHIHGDGRESVGPANIPEPEPEVEEEEEGSEETPDE